MVRSREREETRSPAVRSCATPFEADPVCYDSAYEAPGLAGHVLRSRLSLALRLLGDGPGDVLDVGMGGGRLCVALTERGWTVSGLDPSRRMVELARQRVPSRADSLIVSRAEALPYPDARFDAVLATGAIEFVDDLEGALAELVRVARPGGRVVVSFPNYLLPYSLLNRLLIYPAARAAKRIVRSSRPAPPMHRHAMGRRRFEALLAAAGLELEGWEYVGVAAPRPLAQLLEGQSITAWMLASQIVFFAHRPS